MEHGLHYSVDHFQFQNVLTFIKVHAPLTVRGGVMPFCLISPFEAQI